MAAANVGHCRPDCRSEFAGSGGIMPRSSRQKMATRQALHELGLNPAFTMHTDSRRYHAANVRQCGLKPDPRPFLRFDMHASTVKTLLIAVAAAAALIGAAMLAVPSAGGDALPCVSRCLGF
jgi:hypothetical protein